MKNMEEKLWDYIDGTCSEDERATIAALIETDENWGKALNAMLQMDKDISQLTLEEPPMAFTYNVMEGIRAYEASKPLKTATNTYIIRAIAGFLVLSIIAFGLLTFLSAPSTKGGSGVNFTLPDFSALTSLTTVKFFFYIDTMLMLLLVDTYIRNKRRDNVEQSV